MAYKFQDRLKEWTTAAGALVAASAVAIPQIAPIGPWTEAWQAAQLFLSAALIFLPQNAGTSAIENDGLQLLKALADHVPPQYASALTPFMTVLTAAVMRPKPVIAPTIPVPQPVITPAPVAVVPASTPASAVVEQLPIPGAPVTPSAMVDPAVVANVQAMHGLQS